METATLLERSQVRVVNKAAEANPRLAVLRFIPASPSSSNSFCFLVPPHLICEYPFRAIKHHGQTTFRSQIPTFSSPQHHNIDTQQPSGVESGQSTDAMQRGPGLLEQRPKKGEIPCPPSNATEGSPTAVMKKAINEDQRKQDEMSKQMEEQVAIYLRDSFRRIEEGLVRLESRVATIELELAANGSRLATMQIEIAAISAAIDELQEHQARSGSILAYT